PQSRAIAIRSSSRSWPTMVRFTSNSTGCSGLAWASADWSGRPAGSWVIGLLRLLGKPQSSGSYLRSRAGLVAGGAAERGPDGHRETDAGERVLAAGVGERHHDADYHAAVVKQRAAGAARVDGGVELDQPAALARVSVRAAVKPGDHAGRHAVRQ